MSRVIAAIATTFALSTSVGAEEGNQVIYPIMKLSCITVTAKAGSSFDAPSAIAMIPVPFHLTNNDKRLKYYNAILAFEGMENSYKLAQPRITQSEMSKKNGRYGNLQERQSNDDIPTTFNEDGAEYELQTVSGFPVTETSDDGTFQIAVDAVIQVKIEEVTRSSRRDDPVWIGDCTLDSMVETA